MNIYYYFKKQSFYETIRYYPEKKQIIDFNATEGHWNGPNTPIINTTIGWV